MRREVEPLDVLRRHPGRAEARPELRDRLSHERDPALRQAGLVALVVRREHLLLEHRVERLRVGLVLLRLAPGFRAADREPAGRGVRLRPPAVEDRAVEHAVQRGLHARRARRLVGPPRRVQPEVDALHEPPRERHLVVLEEDDASRRGGLAREVHDELDQILALLVGRVRLAGDEHLDRPLGIGEELREPLGTAEEEARALVRREAAGEADREDVGVELARAAGLDDEPEQTLLRAAVRCPEIVRRQLARALELRIRVAEQGLELRREPRPLVDAVRDRGDRNLVDARLGPEPVPHLPRDRAVQLRDAVRVLRRAERERREPEALVVRLDLAEREEIVPGEAAALDEPAEARLHEPGIEDLVPGRHRRVRREDRRRAQSLDRLVRRLALFLHQLAHPLELKKGGVPLVEVEDGRLEPEAAQDADAADPEQDLLPQPVRPVPAVERVGDRPVRVPLEVGVDEVQGDAPDGRPPDPEPHRDEIAVVVGELDDRRHRHELERQPGRERQRVVLDLAVVLVELLLEVAAAVEEADPDERDPELGRGLEVVAGQDAEPSGVDREALVEAELRGEVGDEEVGGEVPAPPPGLLAAVAREAALHPVQPLEIVRRERAREVLVRQLVQQRRRVVVQLGEASRLERLEEEPRLGDPREREVARDLEERRAQRRAVVYLGHEWAP